jgi:hypothetical protein
LLVDFLAERWRAWVVDRIDSPPSGAHRRDELTAEISSPPR